MRPTLALLLALAACGSDAKDPQITKGDFCDTIGLRVCARAVACKLQKMDECFQGFKTTCCLDKHTCSDAFGSAAEFDSYMQTCGPAIDGQACDEALLAVPSICLVGVR